MLDVAVARRAGTGPDADRCGSPRSRPGNAAKGTRRSGHPARRNEAGAGRTRASHPRVAQRHQQRSAGHQARRPGCRERGVAGQQRHQCCHGCGGGQRGAKRAQRGQQPAADHAAAAAGCRAGPAGGRVRQPADRGRGRARGPSARARDPAARDRADHRPAGCADCARQAGGRAWLPVRLLVQQPRGAGRLHGHPRDPDRPARCARGQDLDLHPVDRAALWHYQAAGSRSQGALRAYLGLDRQP
ncbi:hypothetical protein D9M70_309240 [compost metagenome]